MEVKIVELKDDFVKMIIKKEDTLRIEKLVL